MKTQCFQEVSFCVCFNRVRISILNENAKIGPNDEAECMCIASLIEINHYDCKMPKKKQNSNDEHRQQL